MRKGKCPSCGKTEAISDEAPEDAIWGCACGMTSTAGEWIRVAALQVGDEPSSQMTKRELIAAMVMQGLMTTNMNTGPAALMAVVAADQLIRELNKKEVRR